MPSKEETRISFKESENKSNRASINQEIIKLVQILKTKGVCIEFNEQIQFLASFVKSDGDIYKEISKLEMVLKNYGCGSEFMEQINYLIAFANTKVVEYVPINEIYKDSYNNQEKLNGISFLCDELDKRTGGIMPGTICTIIGGAGSMKTSLAMNISYDAVKNGKNVCYLSLEETPLQLYSKLLSRVSVDIGKKLITKEVTQNKLSDQNKNILLDEVYPYFESLPGLFYLVGENDLINYKSSEIESKLREVDKLMQIKSKEKQNNEEHGIDLLVVDHIQLLKYAENEKDEYQLINTYVSFFRRLALSFLNKNKEISVILLSQANREGLAYAQKHDGAFFMQHVAEASELERASTYMISTYTDATLQMSKILKIGVLKLRGAALPMGTINIFADGEYYQVGDALTKEQQKYNIGDIMTSPEINGLPNLDEILNGILN